MTPEIALAVGRVLAQGERAALATVVRTEGSTPQRPGARLLLTRTGVLGTIGGGRVEEVVIERLRELLEAGEPALLRYRLGAELGMCCGGTMDIFVEPIAAPPLLVVFGAGHVARPTAELAAKVGFSVVVVDDREEFNHEERFPSARRVLAEPAEALASGAVVLDERAYVVIATHDHALDEQALRSCLAHRPRYVGMIGSRRKVLNIFERLRQRSPEVALERVHAPIGLDLGAVSPEEIALAIVAELTAVRRGGAAGFLSARPPRESSGP